MGSNSSKQNFCTSSENRTNYDIIVNKNKLNNYIDDKDMKTIQIYEEKCPNQAKISKTAIIGGSKKIRPTNEHTIYNGKECIIYIGPKGGKYVKKNKQFILIKI